MDLVGCVPAVGSGGRVTLDGFLVLILLGTRTEAFLGIQVPETLQVRAYPSSRGGMVHKM